MKGEKLNPEGYLKVSARSVLLCIQWYKVKCFKAMIEKKKVITFILWIWTKKKTTLIYRGRSCRLDFINKQIIIGLDRIFMLSVNGVLERCNMTFELKTLHCHYHIFLFDL